MGYTVRDQQECMTQAYSELLRSLLRGIAAHCHITAPAHPVASRNVPMSSHAVNAHKLWSLDCVLSAIRGLRNGIITGARVRIPYIYQAIGYALLYEDATHRERLKFVLKQMFHHGRNLGLFVLIYKSICCVSRNAGFQGGKESLIAGFIGGFIAFGESKGISGSVNLQLVLYLFARGIQGFIQSAVKRGILPETLSWTTSIGFRIWAGVSLAMALYLTEYEPEHLSSSFLATMRYLYHRSDAGPLFAFEASSFLPFIATVSLSLLLGYWQPNLFSLDALLTRFIDPWFPVSSQAVSQPH